LLLGFFFRAAVLSGNRGKGMDRICHKMESYAAKSWEDGLAILLPFKGAFAKQRE
jgi:hypothetical protein